MAFNTKSLREFASLASGGTPSKSKLGYWGGTIPWLTPKDMSQFDGKTQDHVTADAIGNGTRVAPAGSLFITVRGMSLHNEIRIVHPSCQMTFNQDIKAIIPGDGVDGPFLYYAMLSMVPELLDAVESAGHGTGVLPTDRLKSLRLPDLSLPEQRAIASVLSALDDKIELNRRMNETLEGLARAMFKDWFVDFGPTRTKQEARSAEGTTGNEKTTGAKPTLAPEIWSLFPNRLDDNGVPEGWEVSEIGKETKVVGGSTPSTKEPRFWGGGIHWTTPKDLSALKSPVLFETNRTITEAGLEKISSGLLPVGTVLLSSRAPIGYVAIAAVPVAVNQGYIALRCEGRLSNVYVWLWLHENMEAIKGNANGSTFQEISKKNFRPLPVVVPSADVMDAFNEMVMPLYERIEKNELESRTLAQTRDLLLPKLISGEIRVREAGEIVEGVA